MGSKTTYKNKQERADNPVIVWFARVIKLSILAAVGFTALSYLPAFVNTASFANITNHDHSAARLGQKSQQGVMKKTFYKVANLRQAYIRAGQSVQVQYYLPEDARLELVITHCKRNLIIEAFSCVPYKTENLTVAENTIGSRKFMLEESGFYKFSHTVVRKSAGTAYQNVFWRRST